MNSFCMRSTYALLTSLNEEMIGATVFLMIECIQDRNKIASLLYQVKDESFIDVRIHRSCSSI